MSKAIKIISIIGIVLSGLAFLAACGYSSSGSYDLAMGWLVYPTLYLLALSIVALVKNK
jgi:hypothetical protein